MQERYHQIATHGHDVESDAMHPVGYLAGRAKFDAQVALDRITTRGEGGDFKSARKALARAAAYALAEYDRLATLDARAEQRAGTRSQQ